MRILSCCLVLLSLLAVAPVVSAAPMTPLPPGWNGSVAEPVARGCGWVDGYCRGRYGRGAAYRNCVWRRGCPVPVVRDNRCRREFRVCADRWYPGSSPFRRCMVRRGC